MAFLNLHSQRVVILGLGDSGLAMARWCKSQGAQVQGWDSRDVASMDSLFASEFGESARLRDINIDEMLSATDLIGISPGLAPDQAPVAAIVRTAETRQIPVWGEFEFFANALRQLGSEGYAPQLVAITGTNGKTTVTSLMGHLCRAAGKSVRVAGNIGPSVLSALQDAIAEDALPQIWSLELSSFQLQSTETFAPDASVFLNLSQDHLDWHGSMKAYKAAKLRIYEHARTRVINRDDKEVVSGEAQGVYAMDSGHVSFGLGMPRVLGDFGTIEEAGMRWLAVVEASEDAPVVTRRQKTAPEVATHVVRLMPAEALRIRGDHNISNALAALALGRAIGLPIAPMLRALANYRGESHRVEVIGQLNGIDFIDDSKGTNVGSTVAALSGLGQRVVLIAGGLGKDQDFSPLAAPVARYARAVFLIGRDKAQLHTALAASASAAAVPITELETLEEAVQSAFAAAEAGDAVLLSPACASLDMFRNYQHRADVFAGAVRELMTEAGQPC